MKSDRETTRVVRTWLSDGPTQLPERVLDTVLDELPATRQRRSALGRWFRAVGPLGLATAATVMMAVVIGLLGASNGGGPGGAPAPTASERATASPHPELPRTYGELEPGRYALPSSFGVPLSIEVGQGWHSCSLGPRELAVCLEGDDPAPSIGFAIIEYVVEDPCDPAAGTIALGPGIEDLVDAIAGLPGFEATDPEPAVVDGIEAVALTVTAPRAAQCQDPQDGLRTWATSQRVNGVAAGETNELLILEVDGLRVLLAAAYHPLTTAAELDELRAALDTITFDR